MRQLLDMYQTILDEGQSCMDRTGTGTISIFGYMMKFPLDKGFPLVTTKKVSFYNVAHELLWLISGSTNIQSLQDKGVHIWDAWADKAGDVGPLYGKQWRAWPSNRSMVDIDTGDAFPVEAEIDQLANVIDLIKTDPSSRRLMVSAWNPADIAKMALPPCHCVFQFKVRGNKLDCLIYQRSCDVFLGVPYNIASYALLTHMVSTLTGYTPGVLTWVGGDVHVYFNHIDQVKEQLLREPYRLPTMYVTPQPDIDSFKYEHFHLEDYNCHPAIKGAVSV
jgi:thymidylate synthase